MRTTLDLPDELHSQLTSLARDTKRTLSEAAAYLMRRGLGEARPAGFERSSRTGLPVMSVGRIITTEDVRALEDSE